MNWRRGMLCIGLGMVLCGAVPGLGIGQAGDLELRYELVPGGLSEEPEPEPETNATQPGEIVFELDRPAGENGQVSEADEYRQSPVFTFESDTVDTQEVQGEPEPVAGPEPLAPASHQEADAVPSSSPDEGAMPPTVAEPAPLQMSSSDGAVAVATDSASLAGSAPPPVDDPDPLRLSATSGASDVDVDSPSFSAPPPVDDPDPLQPSSASSAADVRGDSPGFNAPPLVDDPDPLVVQDAQGAAPIHVAALEQPTIVWEEPYTPEEIEHFLSLALYNRDEQYALRQSGASAQDARTFVVTRWEKDILVGIAGQPSEADRGLIEAAVAELNTVLAGVSPFEIRMDQANAELMVRVIGSPPTGGITGYTDKRYHRGDIIIGCDVILYGQGGLARSTVQRELLYALGFMGLGAPGADTVMTAPDGQAPSGPLPAMDRKALEMLYRPDMFSGMDHATAHTVLSEAL